VGSRAVHVGFSGCSRCYYDLSCQHVMLRHTGCPGLGQGFPFCSPYTIVLIVGRPVEPALLRLIDPVLDGRLVEPALPRPIDLVLDRIVGRLVERPLLWPIESSPGLNSRVASGAATAPAN
jgi:hypothetical protein